MNGRRTTAVSTCTARSLFVELRKTPLKRRSFLALYIIVSPMPKRFVIHEHHARRLHWDLRLEIDGVLKSWAVPKGASLNPADKRLAVAVPDHSVGYIDYEGRISEGSYGAGEVRIWDDGTFEIKGGDPVKQLESGKLVFIIFGLKLRGEFALIK